ncbi:MAG: sodium:solute symporter family protein [Propionibacteriaceae bacterium]
MSDAVIILLLAGGYVVVLAFVSWRLRRTGRTSDGFISGGAAFPAILIGCLMASEFIGTSASLGTAQGAFEYGVSSAWNLVALAAGFIIFSFTLAAKYRALGENTISGVLARGYGDGVRKPTSILMMVALLTVAVAVYASGGAIFASLLGIPQVLATVITGALAVIYVALGGMRSVVVTNVVHAFVMMVGVILAAVLPMARIGGPAALADAVPVGFLNPIGVGLPQIIAWFVAGIGASFATQYIVQAITAVPSERTARRASGYAALVLLPYGFFAAIAGMCAAVLFPEVPSLQALPVLVQNMHVVVAGIVIAGLLAALLGTASAITLAVTTLLLKDFLRPALKTEGNDAKEVLLLRIGSVVLGLLPVALAIFATDVLMVTFLGKALRASLAVLVLLMFYAAKWRSARGALVSIIAAVVVTIGWYALDNPFGIDYTYAAIATPIVIMSAFRLIERGRATPTDVLDDDGPRSSDNTESEVAR